MEETKGKFDDVKLPTVGKKQLSFAQFVLKAIEKLRTGDYKGIHSVYSGFQDAFCKYYSCEKDQCWKVLHELHKEGIIVQARAQKGSTLYKKGEEPERTTATDTLKEMGITL